MEARDQLLQAALKVYAESGTRGATTRRIAQEAGVNEVTLFGISAPRKPSSAKRWDGGRSERSRIKDFQKRPWTRKRS